MGGVNIDGILIGRTVKEAYNLACEKADIEYGHQYGYSGAINSTDNCLVKKLPSWDGTSYYRQRRMGIIN